jgi:hypothetical protein
MGAEIDRQARRELAVRPHYLRTEGGVFPPDGGQNFPDRFAARHKLFVSIHIPAQGRGNMNRNNGNV